MPGTVFGRDINITFRLSRADYSGGALQYFVGASLPRALTVVLQPRHYSAIFGRR
jgi:hypothetical protein